jgi:hypothetical protein
MLYYILLNFILPNVIFTYRILPIVIMLCDTVRNVNLPSGIMFNVILMIAIQSKVTVLTHSAECILLNVTHECSSAECHSAKYNFTTVILLTVLLLIVIMQNVFLLNGIQLNVMAPRCQPAPKLSTFRLLL